MILIKSFQTDKVLLEMKKEENVNNTRFTKYIVVQDNSNVMTSFHYKAASDYFDMILEEGLKNERT